MHKYSKNRNSCFPTGCSDAAAEDGKRCRNDYEVNTWLWPFGRGKPSLGGLCPTREGSKGDCARLEMKCECDLCAHFFDIGLWEVMLGVWDEYMVVPKP